MIQYSRAGGSFQDFLDRGLLLTRKLLNQGFLSVKLKPSNTLKILRSPPSLGWMLWNICVTNYHGYVPLVVNTSRSFPHLWLITRFVTRLTRWVPLVEQELPTLPEHLSLPPVFSGVCVTRSLVLCACFANRCLSFCTFSFGHCVVCSSSIYRFWLPLWYLNSSCARLCTCFICGKLFLYHQHFFLQSFFYLWCWIRRIAFRWSIILIPFQYLMDPSNMFDKLLRLSNLSLKQVHR